MLTVFLSDQNICVSAKKIYSFLVISTVPTPRGHGQNFIRAPLWQYIYIVWAYNSELKLAL